MAFEIPDFKSEYKRNNVMFIKHFTLQVVFANNFSFTLKQINAEQKYCCI